MVGNVEHIEINISTDEAMFSGDVGGGVESASIHTDFPVSILPKPIRDPILAIHDFRQVTASIAGQCVMTAISVATQHISNVEVPNQGEKPLSCYFLSVAESGAGKTSAEHLAMAAINAHADALEATYKQQEHIYEIELEAYKQERKSTKSDMRGHPAAEIAEALMAIGEPPQKPLRPDLVTSMATYAGLFEFLQDGQASVCVSNDDSAAFIQHASDDADMVTLMTGLWSGTKITRTTSGKRRVLKGRRLTTHLMVQPQYVEPLLHGKYTADQGIVPRFNIAVSPFMEKAPPKGDLKAHAETINRFNERIALLIQHSGPIKNRNEVSVETPLLMSTAARARFLSFVDDMTVQSRPGGILAVIRTSAVRASENAARLAGMFALFLGGPDTATIELPELEAAIALTNYYLDQKLTIFRKSHVDPEMLMAEKTWNWLVERWDDPLISLRDLCHYGIPSAVRRVDAASKVIAILEREGHLVRLEGKHQVRGEFRERVWKIIQ